MQNRKTCSEITKHKQSSNVSYKFKRTIFTLLLGLSTLTNSVDCSRSQRNHHRHHKVSHEVIEEEMRHFLPNSTTGINSPTSGLFFYADLTS